MTDTTNHAEALRRTIETMVGCECCPDFSCCVPEALAPLEMRKMFRDEPERREAMLWGFLGNALAIGFSDKDVYVAGKPGADWKEAQG